MKRVLSFLLLQAIFSGILLSQLGNVISDPSAAPRRLQGTPEATSYPTSSPTPYRWVDTRTKSNPGCVDVPAGYCASMKCYKGDVRNRPSYEGPPPGATDAECGTPGTACTQATCCTNTKGDTAKCKAGTNEEYDEFNWVIDATSVESTAMTSLQSKEACCAANHTCPDTNSWMSLCDDFARLVAQPPTKLDDEGNCPLSGCRMAFSCDEMIDPRFTYVRKFYNIPDAMTSWRDMCCVCGKAGSPTFTPTTSPTFAPTNPTFATTSPTFAPTSSTQASTSSPPTEFTVTFAASLTEEEFLLKQDEIHTAMDVYFLGTDNPAALGIKSTISYHAASLRRKLIDADGTIKYNARVIEGASDSKDARQKIAASYQDACRECSQSISIAGLQMTPTTSSTEEKATVPGGKEEEKEQTKIMGIPLTTPVIVGASVGVVAIAGIAYQCAHHRHKARPSLERSVSERAAGIEIGQLQRQASQVNAENPGNPVLSRQISNTDSGTGVV